MPEAILKTQDVVCRHLLRRGSRPGLSLTPPFSLCLLVVALAMAPSSLVGPGWLKRTETNRQYDMNDREENDSQELLSKHAIPCPID